jgi:1-acyl-sn-glycerol-3-phosphate acyltransferase
MEEAPIDVFDFEEIRPYTDEEVPLAIERMIQDPLFYKMMRWVYAGLGKASIQKMMRQVRSVSDFQEQISGPAFKVISQMTTSGLFFSNIEAIEKEKPYLFISNHRDIILDSALLNVSLVEKGFHTTRIAIGDNLLTSPFVSDLVRVNKNFIVNRNISPKEVYFYSLRLSNYIRHSITKEKTSIWIAQREGRSKDGDDRTANGLLKMFTMSSKLSMEDSLIELNILPMAASYEYDPCAALKAWELLNVHFTGSYEKKVGEDFRSMMRGLTGHKGRVHISVGRLMTREIEEMRTIANKNEKIRFLAESIDKEMFRIYKLWPTNFIAYDLLHRTKKHKEHYSNMHKIAFANYIRGMVIRLVSQGKKAGLPKEELSQKARHILLQMYANPVVNALSVERKMESETQMV